MSYITDFEGELTKKLEDGTDNTTAIVRWASGKVLQSYKHGLIAGKKGARVKREGQNSSAVSSEKAE